MARDERNKIKQNRTNIGTISHHRLLKKTTKDFNLRLYEHAMYELILLRTKLLFTGIKIIYSSVPSYFALQITNSANNQIPRQTVSQTFCSPAP